MLQKILIRRWKLETRPDEVPRVDWIPCSRERIEAGAEVSLLLQDGLGRPEWEGRLSLVLMDLWRDEDLSSRSCEDGWWR